MKQFSSYKAVLYRAVQERKAGSDAKAANEERRACDRRAPVLRKNSSRHLENVVISPVNGLPLRAPEIDAHTKHSLQLPLYIASIRHPPATHTAAPERSITRPLAAGVAAHFARDKLPIATGENARGVRPQALLQGSALERGAQPRDVERCVGGGRVLTQALALLAVGTVDARVLSRVIIYRLDAPAEYTIVRIHSTMAIAGEQYSAS
jgi:hypothetical protein